MIVKGEMVADSHDVIAGRPSSRSNPDGAESAVGIGLQEDVGEDMACID